MLSKEVDSASSLLTLLQATSHVGSHEEQRVRNSCGNWEFHRELPTPVSLLGIKKPPVPEPPLKEDLFANEVITLMETGPHTGYQNTLPMSYISNPAVIFTIMSLYEDVSVLWCVYIEVRR